MSLGPEITVSTNQSLEVNAFSKKLAGIVPLVDRPFNLGHIPRLKNNGTIVFMEEYFLMYFAKKCRVVFHVWPCQSSN